MKIKKGNAGYIRLRKKLVIIKTALLFGIVIALLGLGIWQTGDRMNLLTIVAVLGCLPASKSLVETILIFPHHSIADEKVAEIEMVAGKLTRVYDMIFTSEKKIMPVENLVILDNTICGYTSNKKVNTNFAADHIKKYLVANQFTKVSVKIFDNYASFLNRVESMNENMAVDKNDMKEKEEAICRVILSLSL